MAEDLDRLYSTFRNQLFEAKLLVASGVDGLYGRSETFERIVGGIDNLVTSLAKGDAPEVWRFPPVLPRTTLETTGYMKGFPQLAGIVHSFNGKDADHRKLLEELAEGKDWSHGMARTDVVLTPAACYPVYGVASGTLPGAGRIFDVFGYCFRHEPSIDPARLVSFRMRENVCLGTPDFCVEWRQRWLERGKQLASDLGLPASSDLANDPFFGRGGRMLALDQRDRSLKFEVLVPVCSVEKPPAVMSFNYHEEHFSQPFAIHTADGKLAHTACVGFGMERMTLALLKTHGLDVASWPAQVRDKLGL